MTIDIKESLLNWLGFFSFDGSKYKKAIPPKAKILLIPDIKVASIPFPNIG